MGLRLGHRNARPHEKEHLGPRLRGETRPAIEALAAVARGRDGPDVRVGARRGSRHVAARDRDDARALRIVRVVVELGGGERLEELAGDLVGAVGWIARLLEGDGGGARGHLMLAMRARPRPHGEDDLGPLQAHAPHHVAQPGVAPALLDFLGGEGEVEILQADELGRGHADHGQGAAFLLLANQTERWPAFAPDGVAAALASGQGDDRALVALVEQVAGEGGHDAGVIVGMRADEHEVDVHEVDPGPGSRLRLDLAGSRDPPRDGHTQHHQTRNASHPSSPPRPGSSACADAGRRHLSFGARNDRERARSQERRA